MPTAVQHLPALFSDLLQGYFSYAPTEEQLEQAKSWYAQMMDSAEGKAYDQAIMPSRWSRRCRTSSAKCAGGATAPPLPLKRCSTTAPT